MTSRLKEEVSAYIPVAGGWVVDKIAFNKGEALVALECSGKFNQSARVMFDTEKSELIGSFPQAFSRKPASDLAAQVRKAISA